MTSAPLGSTKPQAGVMATRPAIAPEAMPSRLGLPWTSHSENIQASAAMAVAICVVAMATPAVPLAATAEDEAGDETSDAGVDVNDRAAGEVENAITAEEAAAPHPVADRDVDGKQPD